jgi:hypothetical protein
VMETEYRWEQSRDGMARSSFARHALVLNPSPSTCASNRCDSLGNLLRDTRFFIHVHGESGSLRPASMAIAPDVVVLRLSIDDDGLKLVATCGNGWARPTVFSRIKRSGRFSFLSVSD